MRQNRFVTLGGTALASLFVLACNPSVAADSPVARSASGIKEMQRVNVTNFYNDQCSKCHGVNGEGGGGGTPSLNTVDKFDQKWDKPFFDAIKKGVPSMGMDAYGETNSDELIWGLVVHIRELQGRALRAANGSPRAVNGVFKGTRADYKVETVIGQGNGLKTPWGIDWLPDGTMLVTNRPGTLSVVRGGSVVGQVTGIPRSVEIGQGGLMEVAVHPGYSKNGWIYLGYTEPKQGSDREGMTKIVRGKLTWSGSNATWGSQQTIWETTQDNYSGAGVHFGNRIVFDNGKVFFSTGERGQQDRAQQLNRPNGKIHRVNDDGSIPADNPFVNVEGAVKSVWSFGHRNPQGLVMGLDGRLWDTEHGPRGGDELNLIQKSKNYGWPLVAYSINYNDSADWTPWPKDGKEIVQPVFRWMPSIGACGLDVVDGPAFPQWKGDLVAGGLSGANVDRIRTKDGKLVEREELIHGMGRVREVATGPDGFVYVALNQPDMIVRIVPAK